MITPAQQAVIIHESAKGKSTRAIEDICGLDHTTISRAQHKLRALIDAEAELLLTKGLTAARKTTIKFAEYGASEQCVPGESDPQWAKLSHDASKSIISIVTSSQPSTIINNLIQINQAPDQGNELSALAQYMADTFQLCNNQQRDTISDNRATTIDVTDVVQPHTLEPMSENRQCANELTCENKVTSENVENNPTNAQIIVDKPVDNNESNNIK